MVVAREVSMTLTDILLKERIQRFNGCAFARTLGMVIIEAAPGTARVVMDPEGKTNPNGVLHGGAVFTIADQAFGIAANLENVSQVAISARIWYLAPASGRLEARATRVGENGAHSLYQVNVFEGDRLVAMFEGVGIKQASNSREYSTLS
jgi:acyl-CoA thioesterase